MQNSRHYLTIQKIISNKTLIRKIRIKTRPSHWKNTSDPIIVPLSVHSAIYEGLEGKFKISALLSSLNTIPNRKITILICEGAHINCLNLRYNDINMASDIAFHDAQNFVDKFKQELHGYEILFWKDFIVNNIRYKFARDKIYNLYDVDNEFRLKIKADAVMIYNNRLPVFEDKEKYLKNAELDLLEHCIYLLIVSDMGYKFEFYPGKRESCVDYINNKVLNGQNVRVNVTIGSPRIISS